MTRGDKMTLNMRLDKESYKIVKSKELQHADPMLKLLQPQEIANYLLKVGASLLMKESKPLHISKDSDEHGPVVYPTNLLRQIKIRFLKHRLQYC